MNTGRADDPAWFEALRTRFVSGEAALFILHGATQDWIHAGERLLSLESFLNLKLSKTRDIIVHYDINRGLTFPTPAMRALAVDLINARRRALERPETDARILPREPTKALEAIEDLLEACTAGEGQAARTVSAAVIIHHPETLVPSGDMLYLNEGERRVLTILRRWSSAPFLLESNNIVLLLCEHLSQLHPALTRDPQLAPIHLPLPDLERRKRVLALLAKRPLPAATPELTSGLSLVQIQQLLRRLPADADDNGVLAGIRDGKKQQIEQECAGLLEFIQPKHGFESIGGMEESKRLLMRVAADMREGRLRRVPMGMMFVGPMGTGKTVLANAFARECGLNCVTLKNFRDKWVGATESNLEKIISVLEAMGPMIVVIDEGDRAFGGEAGETDGGTSSRVMARLKAFMSDTSHRGSLLFILMTNRPDKLDVDLKRAGRLDIKIPFFSPQTLDDIEAVVQALARKHALRLEMAAEQLRAVLAPVLGFSGADLEALLLLAAEDELVTAAELEAAVADYIPSRDRDMVRYMELLAVFECSSRRLLPETYRARNLDDLLEELDRLRLRLGYRR